jgi:hypothetical protein
MFSFNYFASSQLLTLVSLIQLQHVNRNSSGTTAKPKPSMLNIPEVLVTITRHASTITMATCLSTVNTEIPLKHKW